MASFLNLCHTGLHVDTAECRIGINCLIGSSKRSRVSTTPAPTREASSVATPPKPAHSNGSSATLPARPVASRAFDGPSSGRIRYGPLSPPHAASVVPKFPPRWAASRGYLRRRNSRPGRPCCSRRRLQRFERDDTGPVIFTGTVAIEAVKRPRRIDRLDIRVPVAGVTVADQVAAMSTDLARAADLVANRIVP